MLPHEKFIELAESMFNKKWLCLAGREYIAMITPEMDINAVEVEEPRQVQSGYITDYAVTREVDESHDHEVMEMFFNRPKVTYDMEYFPELNLIGPEKVYLSAADLAEILYRAGRVEMMNPQDCVKLCDDVGIYVTNVDLRDRYEPNYRKPPEEDMAAFKKLYEILKPIRDMYVRSGSTANGFARLFSYGRKTATGVLNVTSDKPLMLGSGVEMILPYSDHPSPFTFVNR